MEVLFAMTLPALVVALFALGLYELVSTRRRTGRKRGTAMSSTGFDILQEALYPSKKYQIEQREAESLMVEEDEQGAPPRSHVDLDKRTAHIHLR